MELLSTSGIQYQVNKRLMQWKNTIVLAAISSLAASINKHGISF